MSYAAGREFQIWICFENMPVFANLIIDKTSKPQHVILTTY